MSGLYLKTEQISSIINETLLFVENQRETAIEALFPDAPEGYRDEWRHHDVFTFWCRLNLENRVRLIETAQKFYR